MTTAPPDPRPVRRTERIACILRLALGLLTFAMAGQFDPALTGVDVAAGATAVGWSALMFIALRSDLLPDQVRRLAEGSHWFDVVLAVTVYAVFLPDPEATPVVAVPLLAYRLAVRYGSRGVLAAGAGFVVLVAGRIAFTRLTLGEFMVRPPMLLAWALTATVVLVLATEARAHSPGDLEEEPPGSDRDTRRGAAVVTDPPMATAHLTGPPATAAPLAPAPLAPAPLAPAPATAVPLTAATLTGTGDERLDSLAACLAMKLDAPMPAQLTDRELEVLVLVGRGHSYGSVASRLFISQSTVRNHIHNLRTKLDLRDRSEVLTLARAVASRATGTTVGEAAHGPEAAT